MPLIDRAVRWVAYACASVATAMLVAIAGVVGYGVFVRYVLGAPEPWTDELVSYLLVYVVMLGAAEVIRRGDSITVDLLTTRLGPRWQRAVEIWGMAAVVVVASVWIYSGWDMVAFSARIRMVSEGYLAVPLTWVQFAIPLGGALIALAALYRLVQALRPGWKSSGGGHLGGGGPRS